MPLYVFRCPSCGDAFEASRLIAARDLPMPCRACASLTERQITSASWQLGSGPPESAVSKAIGRAKARGL